MESISDIKIDLINLITRVSDYDRLKLLYFIIQSELGKNIDPSLQAKGTDKFQQGEVAILKGGSKNQVFEEQGNKSITFQEVQEIMTDESWDQSLDELLAALD